MQYFSIMLAATLDQRSVAAEGTIMSSTATGGETEEEMKAAHTSSATKTTPLDTRSFPSIAPTSSQTAVASAGVPSAFSSSAKWRGGETGLHTSASSRLVHFLAGAFRRLAKIPARVTCRF